MSGSPHMSADQIRSLVAEGDLRIMLMCLVHLTGDRTWLEPPFTPRRDVRLVADPAAGLPPEVADEIRSAVADLLINGLPDPVISDPGPELMQQMMNVCLGEDVPGEYIGMMREDMGFISRDEGLHAPLETAKAPEISVSIIGAGVSGIALGAQLGRRRFLDHVHRHDLASGSLVDATTERIDVQLEDILDDRITADGIAVQREVPDREFALVPRREHHPPELVRQRHEGGAAHTALQVLLGEVVRTIGK